MVSLIVRSELETFTFSFEFGQRLKRGDIICFFGDLGAGKTTFIKGLTAGAAGIDPDKVNSPTFTYLNIYEGKNTIYHFDLYRLRDSDEFLSAGFHEYLYADGICCIEWSEKIADLIPPEATSVYLSHIDQNTRSISILKQG